MKYSNIIKRSLFVAMVALATTACKEDLTIGGVQAPEINPSEETLLYVSDGSGNTSNPMVEMRSSTTLPLHVNATSALDADQTVSFTYDAEALERYNNANGTKLKAIPASWVALSNAGVATLSAGETQSTPVELTITSDGTLDYEATYVVPLTVAAVDSRATLAASAQLRLVFVKDLTALPDCFKTYIDANGVEQPGVKIFSCMEVNDTNPLNNLCFTLEKSGKYVVDALIIFSANINYNEEIGRVYVNCNPNVQALLDGSEKYLKPLQDRGMKVILGILGNHDISGISNLADDTAREFAKELKGVCDAYNLDGVFWDDEYSKYPYTNIPPGFVRSSKAACSRLVYEVWKLQPERWNVAYAYSTTYGLNEVDGVPSGVYCPYALHDYGGTADLSSYFPGMPKSNMGLRSQQFANYTTYTAQQLRAQRDQGYGSYMIFAMDPYRANWNSRQLPSLKEICRGFYDDELVVDETFYPKDWN